MPYTAAPIPISLTTILAGCDPESAERIVESFRFAAAAHDGQQRDQGSPFIDHPVAVAGILWHELGCRDTDVLVAALLHDVLEDCDWIDPEILADLIGMRALAMVKHVTKPPVPLEERDKRDNIYLESLPHLPHESRLLKLADRIHNLRQVVHAGDRAKAGRYLSVSRERFYPLALSTDPAAARLIEEACAIIERFLHADHHEIPGGKTLV